MIGWELVAFVIASGFTAAGLLSAIHRIATNQTEEFHLSFASPPAIGWSALICTFAGPYIALTAAWSGWRRRALPHYLMILAVALSGLWSFCSGVLIVQLAVLARLVV